MRKLNKQQKKLINVFYATGKLDSDDKNYKGNIFELKRKCEELNDYETLYDDINRLLDDIMFADSKEEVKELIARA